MSLEDIYIGVCESMESKKSELVSLTVFGGFAPNSETAQVLSKSLGTRTVMSGSVSQSKNDPSRSLQMIERPLMTADELKALPKGTFIVTNRIDNPEC